MNARRLTADRIGGLIWFVFGAAVVYGSWTMDRLESLSIPPATAPGVVPGLLGIGIIVFGLILLLRARRAPRRAGLRRAERRRRRRAGRRATSTGSASLLSWRSVHDLWRRCCSAAACPTGC